MKRLLRTDDRASNESDPASDCARQFIEINKLSFFFEYFAR